MITEPELGDGGGAGPERDELQGGSRPLADPGIARRVRSRMLLAVAAAVVATSVVWGWVFTATGHAHDPSLHNYRIPDDTCTAVHLQPFTDALGLQDFEAGPGTVLRGKTLDHVSCTLFGTQSAGDGWATQYTATVTVDLHKKTDPRAEFQDAGRLQDDTLALASLGTYASTSAVGVTKPVAHLGELAFTTLSDTRQTIRVLDGGVVLSLSIDGTNQWQGSGEPPTTGGGARRPVVADTKFLRPALVPTMRQLMKSLTSGPAQSTGAASAT
ncbi:hypothetical protein [Streptomyces sp. NPDC020917]|uniref:hypothetical protein n=1 Tax=Streptomyces sp. NPDC020917 TaxID=3365102 RepID=UPI0037897C89